MQPIAIAKKYAGISASLVAIIKNTRTPIKIDFGVGDVIVPQKEKREIPTQLNDFEKPVINTYSLETTINFQKGLNVIIGANNSGKTGLLNVINLLSHPSEISVDDFNKYNLSKFKEEYRDKAPKIVFEYSIQPMKVLSPFCCYYTELC